MLRILRIALASLFLLGITILFVDATGLTAPHLRWMARLQFVPALMSLNIVVLAAIVALTAVFGRVYCSVICPLGVLQDIINRVAGLFAGSKRRRLGRFGYAPAAKKLRLAVLCVFIVLTVLGFMQLLSMSFAGLLDPYSAFGRIAAQLIAPLADTATGAIADSAWQSRTYDFILEPTTVTVWAVMAVAAVTLLVTGLMAWFGGRDYCNKICPVGTLLGYASSKAMLRIDIDTDRCNGCGKCARHCKASCIDPREHAVDYTRCVACMDCIDQCAQHAISYGLRKKQTRPSSADNHTAPEISASRRSFVLAVAGAGAALAANAADKVTDGGLAPIKHKKPAQPRVAVVPAGSRGLVHMRSRCTACQLCIQHCPSGVLHPSLSPDTFMQPTMTFTDGFCRPECTTCSDICPDGAILPITAEEKSSVKTGTAVVDLDACISASAGQTCGLCSRRCPTGAITMIAVSDGASRLRPMVNDDACIGCGSCEYHCPVGRAGHIRAERSAIHIEGIERHRTI